MAKAKTTKTDNNVTDVVDNTETAAQAPVQLTLADLQLLAQIIDLASRRGAFQASEMAQVGTAYNKLSLFLSSAATPDTANDAGAAEAGTAAE